MNNSFTIEKVTPDNFDKLIGLIVALAEFEKLDPPDLEARVRLRKDCFAENPRFESYLGFMDGIAVGYVIIFETYSSFLAKPTLYLEDLFVLPEYRKQGAGYQLFRFLAQLAVERGNGRMEWQVLDWNKNAINFYNQLGASHLKGWYPYRLSENELKNIV
ncbi:MAG: GNAT family N-acetyltransferase [Ignavibacteriae bacterium]|nr:GNAT family N-acetyltransferase [Ignavibacteriota bacterium]